MGNCEVIWLINLITSMFGRKPVTSPPAQTQTRQFMFSNLNLEAELYELRAWNSSLYTIAEDLSDYSFVNFGITPVVTHVFRTQAKQDEIYANDPKYLKKKFKSPHQFRHAIDFRSKTYTKEQIQVLEEYINSKYQSTNYYKFTLRDHEVIGPVTNISQGEHFHLQFARK